MMSAWFPGGTVDGMTKLTWYRPAKCGTTPAYRMSEAGTGMPPSVSEVAAETLAAVEGREPRATAGLVTPQPVPKAVMISPGLAALKVRPGRSPDESMNTPVRALIANTGLVPVEFGAKEKNSGEVAWDMTAP